MAIHFEEPLHSEWERLVDEFFGQYDDEYEFEDEECDRLLNAYMDTHASEELKVAMKELREYLATLPPNIR